MPGETLADLAGQGKLVGRRVRFLGDDIPSVVPRGTVGEVLQVRASEGKATVHYARTDVHDGHPWRAPSVESRFSFLELVDDEAPQRP